MDSLRKKHMKEKVVIQKQQCTTIEKAVKGKRLAQQIHLPKCKVCKKYRARDFIGVYSFSKPDLINDASIKKMIAEQVMQWSEMIERHRKEEWELLKSQVTEQREALDKVIEIVQSNQIKQLEAKYERRAIITHFSPAK